MLTDVLDRPRWGHLHTTIQQLIGAGMTPSKFDEAWTLRQLFSRRSKLNVTPCRQFHRSAYDTSGLRWSTALEPAQQFPGHDADLLITRVVNLCRCMLKCV